jgi:hypothetical protein
MTLPAALRPPVLVLAFAAAFAACQTSTPIPSQGTFAPASSEQPREELVVGCGSIEQSECQFVVEQVLRQLPADRGAAFAVEVMLSSCKGDLDGGNACPRSLAFRDGRAIVEYADAGNPISFALSGPPQQPGLLLVVGDAWSGLIQATTEATGAAGPVPFDLGHCGLSHVVDFDGSFWLPVGLYDAGKSGFINSESGFIGLGEPDRARYRGKDGFEVQLARFPGPKHVYLCD